MLMRLLTIATVFANCECEWYLRIVNDNILLNQDKITKGSLIGMPRKQHYGRKCTEFDKCLVPTTVVLS